MTDQPNHPLPTGAGAAGEILRTLRTRLTDAAEMAELLDEELEGARTVASVRDALQRHLRESSSAYSLLATDVGAVVALLEADVDHAPRALAAAATLEALLEEADAEPFPQSDFRGFAGDRAAVLALSACGSGLTRRTLQRWATWWGKTSHAIPELVVELTPTAVMWHEGKHHDALETLAAELRPMIGRMDLDRDAARAMLVDAVTAATRRRLAGAYHAALTAEE